MTKAELIKLVGKEVIIEFKESVVGWKLIQGKLGYVDEFSEKHDYRKPDYFYIGDISFKVSHIRKVKVPALHKLELKGDNK